MSKQAVVCSYYNPANGSTPTGFGSTPHITN